MYSPESPQIFDLIPSDNDDVLFNNDDILCLPVDSEEHNTSGPFNSEDLQMIDENEELNNHAVKCQSYEISNSYKETTVNNDEATRPDASVDPQNFSNSIEMHYNEETSQPDEKLEIDNHKKNYEMSQPIYLSPSKRYLDHILALDYDVISGNDNLSNLPKEWSNESNKGPGSSLLLGDATRPSSPAEGQNISLKSHNSHVKYKVKSFTVPEFFVEVLESASVGSLEKAIREKVTAMVDALLQWENTRDEKGFIPKAEYLQDSNGSSPKLSCIQPPPQPQTRCTPSSSVVHQGTTETTCSKDLVTENQKVKAFKCKKRLVMDENILDVGPLHQKPNSSENVKRRKFEYFSVLEVEKLIKAVEELGTGSWAKIKEQAFGQDCRRTRTDLRDKWRSLVKTAKMPADKRKGGPLPQELLDKVVAIETRNSQCRDIQK